MPFVCQVDVAEWRGGVAKAKEELRAELAVIVRDTARYGADTAKRVGKFKDQTGALRRGIRGTSSFAHDGGFSADVVSPEKYSSFVESGTRPHEILPLDYSGGKSGKSGPIHRSGRNAGKRARNVPAGAGRGKFLRFYVRGRVVFAKRVRHPGSKPYPFMGPAYMAMESYMEARIERAIPKIQARFE